MQAEYFNEAGAFLNHEQRSQKKKEDIMIFFPFDLREKDLEYELDKCKDGVRGL